MRFLEITPGWVAKLEQVLDWLECISCSKPILNKAFSLMARQRQLVTLYLSLSSKNIQPKSSQTRRWLLVHIFARCDCALKKPSGLELP